jgi:hypothetical protein
MIPVPRPETGEMGDLRGGLERGWVEVSADT